MYLPAYHPFVSGSLGLWSILCKKIIVAVGKARRRLHTNMVPQIAKLLVRLFKRLILILYLKHVKAQFVNFFFNQA